MFRFYYPDGNTFSNLGGPAGEWKPMGAYDIYDGSN